MRNIYARAALFWLGLLAVAVACGAARDLLLAPALDDIVARPVETVALCAVDFALIRLFVRRAGVAGTGGLLRLGAFWTVLTLLFEFGFGHYVMGAPWEALLADYDVLAGRLWPLVLLTTLLGPLAARRSPAPLRP